MEAQKRHRCPQCGYDYEPWIEICPDCGVLIEDVDATPTHAHSGGVLGPDDDPHWTVVTNVPNAIIGNLIKNQLEDAGIPVLMQRAPSADIAQFSYNDYVPQDLRVPAHLLEDARRLVYSGPDRSAGAPFWGSDFDEDDADVDDRPPRTSLSGSPGNLPEGWTMLPTEHDIQSRIEYQRTHGSDTESWYRSDAHASHARSITSDSTDSDFDDEPLEVDKIRFSRPYEREYYDETSGGQPSWIRVVYGILLLVISLPFLFQLFQQIMSFLDFR
ncbi:MAG: hypothetical protein ABI670_12635 [Chloroflexota bacterium]